MTATLESAVSCALDEGPRAGLIALLEVWRAWRHPEIAAAIEQLDACAPVQPLVPTHATEVAHRAAWHELAALADPWSLRRLRRALWPLERTAAVSALQALIRWPDDPRIARTLAELVRDRPVRGPGVALLEGPALTHLQHLDDPRVVRWLPSPEPGGALGLWTLDRRFAGLEVRPLAVDARAQLARLAPLIARYRSPRACEPVPVDPGERAVFADRLQDAGDPLGLALAHEGLPSREGSRWTKRYGWAWTPPSIRCVALPGSVVFRGGRVVALTLAGPLRPGRPDLTDPAWRGVEEVTLDMPNPGEDELLAVAGLRGLVGVSVRGSARLLDALSAFATALPPRCVITLRVPEGSAADPTDLTSRCGRTVRLGAWRSAR